MRSKRVLEDAAPPELNGDGGKLAAPVLSLLSLLLLEEHQVLMLLVVLREELMAVRLLLYGRGAMCAALLRLPSRIMGVAVTGVRVACVTGVVVPQVVDVRVVCVCVCVSVDGMPGGSGRGMTEVCVYMLSAAARTLAWGICSGRRGRLFCLLLSTCGQRAVSHSCRHRFLY